MAVNKIRRKGSYAPLSAHYYKDDAIDEAGLDAELLYVRGLAFCADVLSDGVISDRQLVRFVGVGMTDAVDRAKRLVEVGLWELTDGGYLVRSWLEWNRSKAEITDFQTKDAARKRGPDSGATDPDPPDGPPEPSERSPNGIRPDSEQPSGRSPNGIPPRARTPLHSTPSNSTTSATADAAPKPDDRFDEFWAAYPRKVKKQEALKAWRQVTRQADPGRLITAAAAQAERWRTERKETRYVPHPASWLRSGAYDDQPEPERLGPTTDTDPAAAFDDLRRRGDATAAARILGAGWIDPNQHPDDPTPPAEWLHTHRVAFIDRHADQLRAALAQRQAS